MGIRVLYGGAWGFSASSDTSNLTAVFDKALDNARTAAERVTFPIRLAEKDAIQATFTSPSKVDPFGVPLADKVAFLKGLDDLLNQPGVFQRIGDLTFIRKKIRFADSEATRSEEHHRSFGGLSVLGVDAQGEAHQGLPAPTAAATPVAGNRSCHLRREYRTSSASSTRHLSALSTTGRSS